MIKQKVNLSELKAIGYYVLSQLEWFYRIGYGIENYEYEVYHNFQKAYIPSWVYKGVLELYDITTDDVLVEIAKVKGDHAKDLHYHKISHAFCIILGERCGVLNNEGQVQINNVTTDVCPGDDFYFPTNCEHTFHGGIENDLYFLSIQSPPLLTKNNDDFYFVNA